MSTVRGLSVGMAAILLLAVPMDEARAQEQSAAKVTSVTVRNAHGGWNDYGRAAAADTVGFAEPVAITVSFSKRVLVEGNPKVVLTVGTQNRHADYTHSDDLAGGPSARSTLRFRYWVQASDYDMDGIGIANAGLILNGSTITTGRPTSSGIVREGMGPANLNLDGAIIDISDRSGKPLKVNGGLRSDKVPKLSPLRNNWPSRYAYRRGEEMLFVVYAEPPVTVTGTPRLKLLFGEGSRGRRFDPSVQTTRYADYDAARSRPAALYFSYTVQAEDFDRDGFIIPSGPISLNGGKIVLRGGTTKADLTQPAGGGLQHHSSRVYGGSGRIPWVRVGFVTDPQNREYLNTYRLGEQIRVGVKFYEAVTVTGTPQIGLTIGSTTRQATYDTARIQGTYLVFTYTVQATDVDRDGISITADALTLNGGTIRLASDATTTPALGHAAVTGEWERTPRVDGGRGVNPGGGGPTPGGGGPTPGGGGPTPGGGGPTPGGGGNPEPSLRVSDLAFTGTPAREETYRLGEQIRVAVTFSDAVTVTGTPQVGLTVGAATRQATYDATRSKGTLLTFTYTVQGTDADPDGISITADALTLNSGTISLASDTTTAAALRHAALATDDTRKVDGSTDVVEHGDTREQATLLALTVRTTGEVGETGGDEGFQGNVGTARSAEIAGAVEQAGDADYFRVEVPGAGRLTVETTGTTDTEGVLQGATGQTLTEDDDGGTGSNFRVERQVQAGTYYVAVTGGENEQGIGLYTLSVRFTPVGGGTTVGDVVPPSGSGPPPAGSTPPDGGEPGDGAEHQPAPLRLNTETTGRLEQAGEVDYFRVEVEEAGTLTVEAAGAAAPVTYFGARDEPLLHQSAAQSASGRSREEPRGAAWPVTAGTYHVAVVGGAARTQTGAYTVAVRFTAASEVGPLQATLLNLSPAQAWVHFYCRRAQHSDAASCTAQVQCGQRDGPPVAWAVEVAPETINTYWPGRTRADGTPDNVAAALIAAGMAEADARQRTTCRVFSADPLDVRAYTRVGQDVVPVAHPPAPVDATAPTRVATLLNLAPAHARVHLSCQKALAPDMETVDPCAVRLQCGQQEGPPVAWDVDVAAETTVTYGPGGTAGDLAAALVAAGKLEAEARRRTTCQVFSRDPVDAWAYTRIAGEVVSVANPPAPVDPVTPTRVATLQNLAPGHAWVHFYCRKAHRPDAETADPCTVRLQCGQRDGTPVAWDVAVAPETIFTYWPGRTAADRTRADFEAALIAAGKGEAEARRRTTCQVFSTDPVDVRGYTRLGGEVVPVANPPIMPTSDTPTRIGTLLNLAPAHAWVHFYCRKAHQPDAETVDPCNVRLQCGQRDGASVAWDVEVAPETIVSYWPGRTTPEGTSDNLAAALVAAGKTEAEAQRRTTCQVFSADPVDVRGYTRIGETIVPVKN